MTLLIIVCSLGIFNLRRLGKASEAILQENYRSIRAAENMIDALERQDSATLLFLLENEQQGREVFRENEILFSQWLGRAKDNVTIAGEQEILTKLQKQYRNYLIATAQLRELEQNQLQRATSYYYQTVFPQFKQVRTTAIQLRDLNQETMVFASQEAAIVSQQAIWSMVVTGSTVVAFGLGFSLLLSNRLVKPLREMTRATEEIAEGNYHVAISVKSKDEIGFLGQEINLMSQKLKAFHDLNVGKVLIEKQRSEAIINSITDGIVVVDAELKIIAINPLAATIVKTNSEQAIGNHFLDIFNDRELYEHLKATAATTSTPLLDERQSIITIEGENRVQYYKIAITPVTIEEGTMLGVVLLLQDVTKMKELDRLKSEFVATASHELRTPLTGMAMSINLLIETCPEKLSEREMELLQAAEEDVERLRSLVNDLLDLSKIESGRIEMEFGSLKVDRIIAKAVSMLAVQAQEKRINITQIPFEESIQVKADPNKIIWVLTNLLANALRYSDIGDRIEVTAKRRGEWAYLSVADNGAGIPYEYQGKIFDKFVQVNTEKDVGGSGLGLAICKEIVKAHGGTIWVDSTPGQGSKFTFTLPVVEESKREDREVVSVAF